MSTLITPTLGELFIIHGDKLEFFPKELGMDINQIEKRLGYDTNELWIGNNVRTRPYIHLERSLIWSSKLKLFEQILFDRSCYEPCNTKELGYVRVITLSPNDNDDFWEDNFKEFLVKKIKLEIGL